MSSFVSRSAQHAHLPEQTVAGARTSAASASASSSPWPKATPDSPTTPPRASCLPTTEAVGGSRDGIHAPRAETPLLTLSQSLALPPPAASSMEGPVPSSPTPRPSWLSGRASSPASASPPLLPPAYSRPQSADGSKVAEDEKAALREPKPSSSDLPKREVPEGGATLSGAWSRLRRLGKREPEASTDRHEAQLLAAAQAALQEGDDAHACSMYEAALRAVKLWPSTASTAFFALGGPLQKALEGALAHPGAFRSTQVLLEAYAANLPTFTPFQGFYADSLGNLWARARYDGSDLSTPPPTQPLIGLDRAFYARLQTDAFEMRSAVLTCNDAEAARLARRMVALSAWERACFDQPYEKRCVVALLYPDDQPKAAAWLAYDLLRARGCGETLREIALDPLTAAHFDDLRLRYALRAIFCTPSVVEPKHQGKPLGPAEKLRLIDGLKANFVQAAAATFQQPWLEYAIYTMRHHGTRAEVLQFALPEDDDGTWLEAAASFGMTLACLTPSERIPDISRPALKLWWLNPAKESENRFLQIREYRRFMPEHKCERFGFERPHSTDVARVLSYLLPRSYAFRAGTLCDLPLDSPAVSVISDALLHSDPVRSRLSLDFLEGIQQRLPTPPAGLIRLMLDEAIKDKLTPALRAWISAE